MKPNANHPVDRRQFIGYAGATALSLLLGRGLSGEIMAGPKQDEFIFLEAEGFDHHGGWDLDQQSMDQMGAPYLLAHGLGVPVADAVTRVNVPTPGTYRVWVRTRDWVAPWNAPGAPGRFQVLIDGKPLKETFGTKHADWHWHDGGTIELGTQAKVALHDLTGFEGRCDAILFCKDQDFKPVDDLASLTRFRRRLLNLPDQPEAGGSFDLVVVGAGLAGTCAAISAARNGLTVALVQDRAVLGGNGSSEVRVWPEGKTRQEPFPHVGGIVDEIVKKTSMKGVKNGAHSDQFDDQLKMAVVAAEPRITLLAEQRAMEVENDGDLIRAIVIQNTRTAVRTRITGRLFADCTGDAKIGYLAGADYEYALDEPLMGSSNLFSVLDAAEEQQVLECECKDKAALTTAYEKGDVEQAFPRCPWALDLSDKPFPGRAKFSKHGQDDLNNFARQWYWESGFDKDQIEEIERIRDHNFRAMYGAWDALKNVDGLYPTYRLGWAAFIAGKRESRRLMGDIVLDGKDFMSKREFPDAAFPCSWHIDLHFPKKDYQKGFENDEFISDYTRGKGHRYEGIYWAPYRCLYSRNINNLFMAGRDISVSKTGLGAVRVMKTCGMMGEIVGKAASICVHAKTTPRGVYETHLSRLQELMRQPAKTRA